MCYYSSIHVQPYYHTVLETALNADIIMTDQVKPVVTVELSKRAKHLVFRSTIYDDLGFGEQKTAIMPIDPEKPADEVLEKALELDWEFSDKPDSSGFYRVKKA